MLALIAAAAAVSPATATYPAGFYAQFAPANALDMIRQTPGFSLVEGADRRGLGGSAGNVLIDGARPSAKAASLADLLEQIPAAQVVRIELLPGAAASGAPTQGLIANVVLRKSAGAGRWSLNLSNNERGHLGVGGLVSWSGPTPAGELTLSLTRTENYLGTRGVRVLGPVGGPGVTRMDESPRNTTLQAATAQLSERLAGGEARANLSLRDLTYKNVQETRSPTPGGLDRATLDTSDSTRTAEVGGDYKRTFGPVTFTLVGLDTERRFTDTVAGANYDVTGARVGQQLQKRRTDTSEAVARGSAAWTWGPHHLQLGAEAARNIFEAKLALELDTGAGLRPVVLPAANVRLREVRGEAFAEDELQVGGFQLQARLAIEVSRLTQSGDTSLRTDLSYLKPQVQVTRDALSGAVRVKLFRDVSQLSFEDFVSFGSLADERVVGGNPNLRPQTQWRLEAAYTRRLGTRGALDLLVYRAWAKDVADVVPLLGRFDGPGNIGDGDFWGAAVKLTAPLDAVLPGGLLNVQAQLDKSRVTDPTTGRTRRASGLAEHYVKVELRQDLTAWRGAWGVSVEDPGPLTFYRRAETERQNYGPRWEAFAERSFDPDLKVRLFASNLSNFHFHRLRTFYVPDRTGAPVATDFRNRSPGRFLGLEVRGGF